MPTITIGIPGTTFVSSAQPGNNFSFFPLMYAGIDPVYQNCISLMNIDLPVIPAASVVSAQLQLSVIVKSGAQSSPILVNKVTEAFNANTVTYTSAPAYTATGTLVNVNESDLFRRVQFDITDLVNEWLAGTSPNYGLALTNTDISTLVQFATDNIVYEPYFPTLTIAYSDEPPPPHTGTNALCFSYGQLAHLIEQFIVKYPSSVFTVFTRGLVASSVTGTPYQLFKSADGTFGSLFILMDAGQQEAIPLNAIAAIYLGDGTVYDPTLTYLPTPEFAIDCDYNLISAYYEYLPVGTEIAIYLGSNISASGNIYKNEYGVLVLSDDLGNTPIFLPVAAANVVLPTFPPAALAAVKSTAAGKPEVTVTDKTEPAITQKK